MTKENKELFLSSLKEKLANYNKELLVKIEDNNNYCGRCNIRISATSKLCQTCNGLVSMKIPESFIESMRELVWKLPITKIVEQLNVSDNTVIKYCKKNKIERPKLGFWLKRA